MIHSRRLISLGTGFVGSLVVVYLAISSLARFQSSPGCRPSQPLATGFLQEGNIDPTQSVAFWNNRPLTPPAYLADSLTTDDKRVLGVSNDDKWIEIDLGRQMLFAHQNQEIIIQSPISSGLWNKTPEGEYRIWYKVRSTKMEGGSKINGSYYYLPNVPYAMFFHGDYGIHGTYWHSNFGRPMSHGCVNSPTPVAEKLFYWTDPQLPSGKYSVRSDAANPGTRVVVHK